MVTFTRSRQTFKYVFFINLVKIIILIKWFNIFSDIVQYIVYFFMVDFSVLFRFWINYVNFH